MKSFHNLKSKACPHVILNTSRRVIRSWELFLATSMRITRALRKQGITDYERITISRGGEEAQT